MAQAFVGEIVLFYTEGDMNSSPTPGLIEKINPDGVADILLLHSQQALRFRPAVRPVDDPANVTKPHLRKEYGTWDLTESGKYLRADKKSK